MQEDAMQGPRGIVSFPAATINGHRRLPVEAAQDTADLP
jgi:hypothetical protein